MKNTTWTAYAWAFVSAAAIFTAIYAWCVLAGDTSLGGM